MYIGGGNGDLVALDLASGKLRWKYATGNLIGESSPAVGAGAVYIGDLAGMLHAVNIADGKRLWTFKTGSEIKSSPVVVGDTVLIGSYDSHLYAVDARTGQAALEGDDERAGARHAGRSARPRVHRRVRFDSPRDPHQRRQGGVSDRVGAYTGASPLIDGTRAYFGTFNNEVLAFDLTKRRMLWRYSEPGSQVPVLFVGRAGQRPRHPRAAATSSCTRSMPRTGKAAWTFATRARVDSSPVVAGGRVYIGSGDGRLYVLDAQTGKKISEFEAGAGFSASPAIAAGRVVIGAQDGRLYVLG